MAVFLYASISLAVGTMWADYCCYNGNQKWSEHVSNDEDYFPCCCEASKDTCDMNEVFLDGNGKQKFKYFSVKDSSCLPSSCDHHKKNQDICHGKVDTCTLLSKFGQEGLKKGTVVVWRVYTLKSQAALRSLERKVSTPVSFKVGGNAYKVFQARSKKDPRVDVGFDVRFGSESFLLGIEKAFGLTSGGNATATAEEADEVMDKFLADAEMELSNPVLITSVGAIFVILLVAIYCFCCKKKRGANDSRSESHGRQHSNKRNATRYTKPRKEFRKAHE